MAKANTELRRLMQLRKASAPKIEHPLAKYNNLEQLSCVICTKTIKDESLWNAHLQSKRHKENVLLVKTKSNNASSAEPPSKCAKYSGNNSKDSKTFKNPKSLNNTASKNLPGDFFDQKVSNVLKSASVKTPTTVKKTEVSKPVGILKNSSSYKLPTVTRKDIEKSNTSSLSPSTDVTLSREESVSLLNRKRKIDSPSDMIDKSVEDTESTVVPIDESNTKQSIEMETKKNAAEVEGNNSSIPEGFFDDPKKDAAARNVEYKDPKEMEWELFQKVIQEETKVAEAIQEEEDEESEMHKDLTELNKMKSCLSRVENLKGLIDKEKQKKLELKRDKQGMECDPDSSGDSDVEIDSIFDWRAKVA